MRTTEAVRAVVKASGESARAVSRRMGRTDTYVSSVIGQAEWMDADLTASTVAGVAAACGHSLALVPDADVPGSAIVIDAG